MIRDIDNNVIFQVYTKGKGADNGIDAPHEKEFYLYMPVLKETAQYYFSEAWGRFIRFYEMKVISKDELPENNSVSVFILSIIRPAESSLIIVGFL